MSKNEIIKELSKYFSVRELVCPHVFSKFGSNSWQVFDKETLEVLLALRVDIFKKPMIINNWNNKGNLSQRGYRCNICQIVKDKTKQGFLYLSSHTNGKGFDADVLGLDAQQARDKIKELQHLLPYNIRVESGVSWLHVDIYGNENKYSEFRV